MTPAGILMRMALVAALAGGVWAFWIHYTGLIAERAKLQAAFADAVQAFDDEQRTRFIDQLNEKKVPIGYPGHFYVLPYFTKIADPA